MVVTHHTSGSGDGSFRGVTVRVLLRVHLWPLGGGVSQALSLTPSVRDLSWILLLGTMNQHRQGYRETKVLIQHITPQRKEALLVSNTFS